MFGPHHSGAYCPDWYESLRAAKFAGVPWSVALDTPWTDLMETCCLISEAAEADAEAYHVKKAQDRARH